MNKNYYQILGISYTATQEDIKNAFRLLAKQYHPDINKEPNATQMMKKITEAYKTLSDIEKRKEYNNKINISSCKNKHLKSIDNQSKKMQQTYFENWLIILMFKYNGDIEKFIKDIFMNFGYNNDQEENIKQKKVKKDK